MKLTLNELKEIIREEIQKEYKRKQIDESLGKNIAATALAAATSLTPNIGNSFQREHPTSGIINQQQKNNKNLNLSIGLDNTYASSAYDTKKPSTALNAITNFFDLDLNDIKKNKIINAKLQNTQNYYDLFDVVEVSGPEIATKIKKDHLIQVGEEYFVVINTTNIFKNKNHAELSTNNSKIFYSVILSKSGYITSAHPIGVQYSNNYLEVFFSLKDLNRVGKVKKELGI